jgi:hypothetical protein
MENEELENETPKNEEATEESEPSEEENPETSKDLQSALAQKDHWREKAKSLEEKLNKIVSTSDSGTSPPASEVDIADLADKLSAVQGLDAAERGRLIKEAKMQGTSLEEARKSDDFKFWRSAYRAKVEKDKAPKPSTKQSSSGGADPMKTYQKAKEGTKLSPEERMAFKDGLSGMSDEEREEFLIQVGAISPRYARYSDPDKQPPGVRRSGVIKKANRMRYKRML